jgi:hypothetical protein
MKAVKFAKLWVIYFLLTFPLFYFVYKYGTPDLGLKDFFSYYKLYESWDIDGVDAPFNMRLLSSFIVYLLNKCGLHYDTVIAFDRFNMSRQVFFNAVFFNMLCVVTTCVLIYMIVERSQRYSLLSFCSGALYLLGFGTIFYELMPITDALSVLLFAWVLYYYLERSYLVIIPLLLLILQREYVFLALGLVALLDLWKYRNRYFLSVAILCVISFAIYIVLRKTVFYTPTYDHQASAGYFLESILKIQFPLLPYIKQTMMTINIFILYLLVVMYKKYHKMNIDSYNLLKIVLLFVQINVISFAAVFGNNTGRYFYILVPMIIYYLSIEIRPLLLKEE